MARFITVSIDSLTLNVRLHDTPTADAVWNALPFDADARTWGDEIYFAIPVSADMEGDAAETVGIGDVAYWPSGSAFCVFFGPTPVSKPGEIRPASAVNVFGRVEGDVSALRQVADGTAVRVGRADA